MSQPWRTQAHRERAAAAYGRGHPRVPLRLSAEDQRSIIEDYLAPVVAQATSLIDEPRITEMLLQLSELQLRELLTCSDKLQRAIQRMWTVRKADMIGAVEVEPEREGLSPSMEQKLQRAFETSLIGCTPNESGDGNLQLAGEQIGEAGGRSVGQTLLTFQQTLYKDHTVPLVKIQLSYCGLNPRGIAHLATAIRNGMHELCELDVSGNPLLGDGGMKLLAWAINPWHCSRLRTELKEFHFRGTGCGDTGLSAVLKSVAYENSNIVNLSCGDNQITAKGFWALGAVLAKLPCLQGLYLSDCKQMGNAGAKALSRGRKHGNKPGLSMCSSLHTLDVCRCNLGDSGMLALIDTLRNSIVPWGRSIQEESAGTHVRATDSEKNCRPHYPSTARNVQRGDGKYWQPDGKPFFVEELVYAPVLCSQFLAIFALPPLQHYSSSATTSAVVGMWKGRKKATTRAPQCYYFSDPKYHRLSTVRSPAAIAFASIGRPLFVYVAGWPAMVSDACIARGSIFRIPLIATW